MRNNAFITALGGRCRRTPMILGLSMALFMPFSSLVYASDAQGVSSVQVAEQSKKINGTVIDETGEPMIGVSVLVKGTTVGTITDFDGKFSLDVPAGKNTLEVSYIGYKNQIVAVGNNTQLNIKLQPDTQALDEVVVIGYGTVKKRDLTGAVTSVKSADITLNPGSNPMEALQGKVAGLDITKESGKAGESVKMQLRGTRSFTASGNPTFIIDGMAGDYATLNPNDIESIEVLKDASSTAVYGSSGANGVIIITTKSGKAGKINVNLNAYVGINGMSTTPEMRSGDSYLQVIRDANSATGNWASAADDERVMDGLLGAGAYEAHQNGQYINWVDEVLQNNLTQNYSLSVSGGNEKTKAYMSLNFTDEAGQYSGDDYKLYSSNIRIDHALKKWLKIGLNAQLSYAHKNSAYANLETALNATPLGQVRDEDGNLNVYPTIGGSTLNILLNTQGGVYKNQGQTQKLYFNPYIEITPIKGLSIISRIGGTLTNSRTNYYQGEGSYQYYNSSGATASGVNDYCYAKITDKRGYSYKWENIITYNFQIMKDHDFTVTAVTTWNHNQNDETQMTERKVTNNKYLWHNMGAAGDANSTVYSTYNMSKGIGLVGRLAYSYKGRYLFSASVRRDASSRLSKDNRWDTFPAVSAGWRISDESFMSGTSDWLSNLKLRAGYGVTGTAGIDPYSSEAKLEQSNMSFSGIESTTYLFSKNYTNKNLGWEKSHNTNIGLDVSLFNNRIDLTADYYITKTNGVIWERLLPANNGMYSASEQYNTNLNICETKNNGIELALNTRNIMTKDFTWNSTVTFNYNKEKIVALTGGTADNITNKDYALSIGYPVNSFYHYRLDGIWQLGEEEEAAIYGQAPGDYKVNVQGMVKVGEGQYKKLDDDGKFVTDKEGNDIVYSADNPYDISDKDYQVLGHNSPDWTLGFQNTFTYKNFDLSVFAYMRWGQTIKYKFLGSYDPTGKNSFPTYFDYWTPENASNDFPAANANKAISDYKGYYARQYVDGSYLKIKNITLGYSLPKSVLKKINMERCRFYATVTNPFVFAKSHLLKDYDPEMNGSLNYPLTKQFVFGVNVSF